MAATRVLQPDTGNSINLRHGEMAIYTSHLGTLHWVLYIGSYSSILILTSLSHQYLNISSSWDIVVNFGHLILTYDFVVKSICHVWDLFCCSIMSTWYWPNWAINTWSYSNVPTSRRTLSWWSIPHQAQYITQFYVTKYSQINVMVARIGRWIL